LARRLVSLERLPLILMVPAVAYALMRESLVELAIVLVGFPAVSLLAYHYFRRKKLPSSVDEKLAALVLHMYAISHGEVGPEDLIKVVADNKDYGYYSRVFAKIRSLAKNFGYGFTKATSIVAGTVKPPLKDILVRCTAIFSTTDPRGFLELESSTMAEEYSGYYLRSIESMRLLAGIFSTFQSVAIFIIMTLAILTIFMADSNMVYYSYAIATCALLVVYLGLRAVVPKDTLVYTDEKYPSKMYRTFRLCLPIAFAVAGPAVVVALMFGPPYAFLLFGSVLLLPGLLALRLERFVCRVDENYPAFIKSLGENMASTSSLKSALSYVLYMELGPLKTLLQRTLARVRIGISNEKSLNLLSSEASSYRVHMTNKIFTDAVYHGGNPLEIGKILGNNCVRFLEFRKRRKSVANSFQAVVVVLQPITVSLLVILTTLCGYFSKYLTSLPFFTFGQIPIGVIEMGNIFIILFMTVMNSLGVKDAKGGFWGTTLLYAGILLILSGAAWLAIDVMMNLTLGQLPMIELPTEI